MRKKESSRLTRKEKRRSLRRTFLFGFLTLILSLGLIFLGVPLLIKMAIFIGNLRGSYTPVEIEDTLAPSPPRLKPLPEATNSRQITIQGFAEAGSTVEIFLTGIKEEEVVAESDGSFLTSNLELTSGRNEIYAIAIDKEGNQSQPSGKLVVAYDDEPPELNITQPESAEVSTDEKEIEIQGETNEEVTIMINDRLVIVDVENKFSYSLGISEGENKIKIVATDKAGNETEKEITVKRE